MTIQDSLTINNNLFHYISKINRIPILTEEEEILYSKQKDNGNIEAVKILISSHLRLVVKIANQYKNYGLPMMDLISEGNIGLMRAIKTFDYSKGYKLATYSMWWIKAYIQEYILKTWSIVKIGTNAAQKKLFFNLRKIKNDILLYTNRKNLNNNDIMDISNKLNVTEQDVIDMDSRTAKGDLYLNNKSRSDEDTEIIDLIPSKQLLPDAVLDKRRSNAKNSELLRNSLSVLNEREKEVVISRRLTNEPMTLAEVSKKLNISGERVRQIEAAAIEKMREYIIKS